MNPGIKLESAPSGLNYSSWLFLAGDKWFSRTADTISQVQI